MNLSPGVALLVHVAGVIVFVWFVFWWQRFYYQRIDPLMREKVSQRLNTPIILVGYRRYQWATDDPGSTKKGQVFLYGLLIAIVFGLFPDVLALVTVGLMLSAVNRGL